MSNEHGLRISGMRFACSTAIKRIRRTRSWSDRQQHEANWLAGETVAIKREPVDRTENSSRDLLRPEEFLRQGLHFLACHRLNGGQNFVERREAVEVEFLARKIGHSGTRGLKREH